MMNWKGCRRKGDRVKDNEVGEVCDANEGENKCMQDFG
jgi:hypothetical protein